MNQKFTIIASQSRNQYQCEILAFQRNNIRIRVYIEDRKHDCTRSIERFYSMLDDKSREIFKELYPEKFI